MVGVRIRQSGSWLDPRCSGLLGWKLNKRLQQVIRGRKGLFLTLTYRRDEYCDALDLYRSQSEQKHVAMFMRRVQRRLGVSLKGKWLRKMEFQRGGWVHWHIIVLDVERIDHALLTEAWGRGHVWIERLSKRNAAYLTKYVAKGGISPPAFIYGEAPKSVKIIAVSPGFWLRPAGQGGLEAWFGRPRRRREVPLDRIDRWGHEIKPHRVLGCYVPIGVRLQRQGVIIRVGHARERRIFSVDCDPGSFLMELGRRARQRLGSVEGWLAFDAGEAEVGAAVAAVGTRSTGGADVPPRSGGLHLRGTSNRDVDDEGALVSPQWLLDVWEEDARQLAEPDDVYVARVA